MRLLVSARNREVVAVDEDCEQQVAADEEH
jgi:hypothetical protein